MSKRSDQEAANVELVRRMWDAFHSEGILAVLAFAAPDARWEPYSAGGRVFETTAQYRAYIEEMVQREEVLEATLCTVKAAGDYVLVDGRIRLRDRGGLRDTNLYWLHRVRDGKIVFTASFLTADEALAVAGVRPSA